MSERVGKLARFVSYLLVLKVGPRFVCNQGLLVDESSKGVGNAQPNTTVRRNHVYRDERNVQSTILPKRFSALVRLL